MLSIRMRRVGSKKRPFYRVVVTEARTPREGSFLEVLGSYNPRSKPATVEIDRERVQQWIKQGARPSDSVRTLLSRHLTRDRGAASAQTAVGESAATSAVASSGPSGTTIAAAALGVAGAIAAGVGIASAIAASRSEPAAPADSDASSASAETPAGSPDTPVSSPS